MAQYSFLPLHNPTKQPHFLSEVHICYGPGQGSSYSEALPSQSFTTGHFSSLSELLLFSLSTDRAGGNRHKPSTAAQGRSSTLHLPIEIAAGKKHIAIGTGIGL